MQVVYAISSHNVVFCIMRSLQPKILCFSSGCYPVKEKDRKFDWAIAKEWFIFLYNVFDALFCLTYFHIIRWANQRICFSTIGLISRYFGSALSLEQWSRWWISVAGFCSLSNSFIRAGCSFQGTVRSYTEILYVSKRFARVDFKLVTKSSVLETFGRLGQKWKLFKHILIDIVQPFPRE